MSFFGLSGPALLGGFLFPSGSKAQTISTSSTKAEALQLQSSAYGVTVPMVHGTTRITVNLLDYQDFKAIPHTSTQSAGGKGGGGVKQESTTYTYTVSFVMGLGDFEVSDIVTVWKGKKVFRGSNAPSQINAGFLTGAIGQSMWSPLSTINGGSRALAYSGVTCVVAQDYDLGDAAQIENHAFEVVAGGRVTVGSSTTADADPSVIVTDWLTSSRSGVSGIASATIGDLTSYSTYCKAAGLLLSPALTEQAKASERIKLLCDVTNSAVVMLDEKINIVPLGDETLTGHGVTYTPNLTPIYDLTPDQFSDLKPSRKSPADAYNSVKVEYLDRAADYNVAVATAEDRASIDQYGRREANTITCHWICDKAVADQVAQIFLKRFRYLLNSYTFSLPWNFANLVPTNIVTLSDPSEGLDRSPVRIETIAENDEGFELEVIEFPHSVAGTSSYPLQVTDGFKHDYNANPGNAQAPIFIEPPVELTTTGLEVWIATASTNVNYGGCHVWISLDGSHYKKGGTLYGSSRMGTLSAAMTSGATSAAVQLSGPGQIISGSAADASALNTLCWTRSPSGAPEFFSHQGATLTGAGAYTLGGLVRGAYSTTPIAHASASPFVRVDQAIVKSDPLQLSMVGKSIYVKLQSFNIVGGGLQDISTLSAYSYTITGEMAKLPPPNVGAFSVGQVPGGVMIVWDRPANTPDYQYTEIRIGSGSWSSASSLFTGNADQYVWPWPSTGTYTIQAKHFDYWGAESVAASTAVIVVDSGIQLHTVHLADSAVVETLTFTGNYILNNSISA